MARPLELDDLSDEIQADIQAIKSELGELSSRIADLPDINGELGHAESFIDQALRTLEGI